MIFKYRVVKFVLRQNNPTNLTAGIHSLKEGLQHISSTSLWYSNRQVQFPYFSKSLGGDLSSPTYTFLFSLYDREMPLTKMP